ncbi:MAG: tRNA-intron lyase [Halodesulfurarchaeum sp.]
MDGEWHGDEVHVGGNARQRLHDARGYGRPLEGNRVALDPVEAAHLLYRGDLERVDGLDFRAYLTAQGERFGPRFLVYLDLRDRGFYLSPARSDWDVPAGVDSAEETDFVVYPRGNGPEDGEVAHRIRVIGERTDVAARSLGGTVLAVVDEEGDITYLSIETLQPEGSVTYEPAATVTGTLLDDRVVCWSPPTHLHERGFYGQPLAGRAAAYDALHLSLVEAAYLAAGGSLRLEEEGGEIERLVTRGRAVEGERFDRRLRVFRALRDAGSVPKTGFKFGADFRVYREVESVDDLGHSDRLVRVLPAGHEFAPRDLALDVRLAHGVRKRMVFALDGANGETIRWLAASRLTP